MRKPVRDAVLVGLLLSAAVAWQAWDARKQRANAYAFQRLHPGAEVALVRSIVGRSPDCTVQIRHSEAWYFEAKVAIPSCPTKVSESSRLPRAYASLQVLIGPDGRVSAVAFDGESTAMATIKKEVAGSALAELSMADIQ